MQPTSRGNPRGTRKKTCGKRRTRRTRGSHPEAHPEATSKSPRTHTTNVQCAPVHLRCAGVPSPAPFPACLAAPRAVAVVAEVLVAVAGVVGVLALVGSPAVAVAAAFFAVEDTWVAADNPGAGTCTGGSWSSKAFLDPSSSAGTRTTAHTRIAAHTDTHAAADTHTPPRLSAEHAERAKQVRHGKANPEAVTEWNVQTA